jgi:hypothetical protein
MTSVIQIKRGTASAWTSANTVLAAGEVGFETDTKKMKVGDGSTAWTSLGYTVTDGDISGVTAGTGLSGGGNSGAVTLAIDSTVATLTGTQTLTNKTLTSPTITSASGVINNTLTTTTGDLIYASSANTPARLGIGSTSQVLTVSGGVPTWATPASSGGTTLITDVQLSGSSGYDFSTIPGTYKNLILTFTGLTISSTGTNFGLRFNNNQTGVYENYVQYQESPASTPSSYSSLDTTVDGAIFGNQTTSGSQYQSARGSIIIYDYASTTRTKYYDAKFSYYSNNNGRTNFVNIVGNFNSTTAISSLNIVRFTGTSVISNAVNTSIRLYGVS